MSKLFSDRTLNILTKFYGMYIDDEYTDPRYYQMRPSYNTKEDAKKEIYDEAIKHAAIAGGVGLGAYGLYKLLDD